MNYMLKRKILFPLLVCLLMANQATLALQQHDNSPLIIQQNDGKKRVLKKRIEVLAECVNVTGAVAFSGILYGLILQSLLPASLLLAPASGNALSVLDAGNKAFQQGNKFMTFGAINLYLCALFFIAYKHQENKLKAIEKAR